MTFKDREVQGAESFSAVAIDKSVKVRVFLEEHPLIVLREGCHPFDCSGDDDFFPEERAEIGIWFYFNDGKLGVGQSWESQGKTQSQEKPTKRIHGGKLAFLKK